MLVLVVKYSCCCGGSCIEVRLERGVRLGEFYDCLLVRMGEIEGWKRLGVLCDCVGMFFDG